MINYLFQNLYELVSIFTIFNIMICYHSQCLLSKHRSLHIENECVAIKKKEIYVTQLSNFRSVTNDLEIACESFKDRRYSIDFTSHTEHYQCDVIKLDFTSHTGHYQCDVIQLILPVTLNTINVTLLNLILPVTLNTINVTLLNLILPVTLNTIIVTLFN